MTAGTERSVAVPK